jgi:hypothetical protein
MATSGPRKALVELESLPNITYFDDNSYGYRVRYRIASEDRSRFSHYSPIYKVQAPYIFFRSDGRSLDDLRFRFVTDIADVIWDNVFARDSDVGNIVYRVQEYDVFLRWSGIVTIPGDPPSDVLVDGVWFFQESVVGKSVAFYVPESFSPADGGAEISQRPNRLSVEVYVKSTNPSRNNSRLLVYKKDNVPFTVVV